MSSQNVRCNADKSSVKRILQCDRDYLQTHNLEPGQTEEDLPMTWRWPLKQFETDHNIPSDCDCQEEPIAGTEDPSADNAAIWHVRCGNEGQWMQGIESQ